MLSSMLCDFFFLPCLPPLLDRFRGFGGGISDPPVELRRLMPSPRVLFGFFVLDFLDAPLLLVAVDLLDIPDLLDLSRSMSVRSPYSRLDVLVVVLAVAVLVFIRVGLIFIVAGVLGGAGLRDLAVLVVDKDFLLPLFFVLLRCDDELRSLLDLRGRIFSLCVVREGVTGRLGLRPRRAWGLGLRPRSFRRALTASDTSVTHIGRAGLRPFGRFRKDGEGDRDHILVGDLSAAPALGPSRDSKLSIRAPTRWLCALKLAAGVGEVRVGDGAHLSSTESKLQPRPRGGVGLPAPASASSQIPCDMDARAAILAAPTAAAASATIACMCRCSLSSSVRSV